MLPRFALPVPVRTNPTGGYAPGQRFRYRTRPGEEASRLLVNRVELAANGQAVFHVSVSGVRIRNPHGEAGPATDLQHLPVSIRTLRESALVPDGEARPNLRGEEGYLQWRKAAAQGKGGVFDLPLDRLVAYVEELLVRGRKE